MLCMGGQDYMFLLGCFHAIVDWFCGPGSCLAEGKPCWQERKINRTATTYIFWFGVTQDCGRQRVSGVHPRVSYGVILTLS